MISLTQLHAIATRIKDSPHLTQVYLGNSGLIITVGAYASSSEKVEKRSILTYEQLAQAVDPVGMFDSMLTAVEKSVMDAVRQSATARR